MSALVLVLLIFCISLRFIRFTLIAFRADTRVCGTAPRRGCHYDCNDTVNVIRHKDILPQFDMRKFAFRLAPPMGDYLPRFIQNHLTVNDAAEQTLPVLNTYRHEITSGLRVIVSFQTIRFSAFWAGIHGSRMIPSYARILFRQSRMAARVVSKASSSKSITSGATSLTSVVSARARGEPPVTTPV